MANKKIKVKIYGGSVIRKDKAIPYTFNKVVGKDYYELTFLKNEEVDREYQATQNVNKPSKDVEMSIDRITDKNSEHFQNDQVWNDLVDTMRRTKGADYVKHTDKRIDILKPELTEISTTQKQKVNELVAFHTTRIFVKLLPGQVKEYATNYVKNNKF